MTGYLRYLIMQHQALPNNTSESLAATTWATKKQGFTDMLSGFRSPTGTTYRVALDLASVLFVSVAAADANRRSLMAQNEAQQKLVEQHEKHRERLEEEFTLNLKKIREENQKTLDQTVRIREELTKACQPGNNDGMVEKIEGYQGADIVKYQLKLMQAKGIGLNWSFKTAGRCMRRICSKFWRTTKRRRKILSVNVAETRCLRRISSCARSASWKLA